LGALAQPYCSSAPISMAAEMDLDMGNASPD